MVIIAWETFHDASCDDPRMVLLRMCHGRDSGVETNLMLESEVCPQLARSNEVRFGTRNVSHQYQLKTLEFISYRTSRFFLCFFKFNVSTSASYLFYFGIWMQLHGIQKSRCIQKSIRGRPGACASARLLRRGENHLCFSCAVDGASELCRGAVGSRFVLMDIWINGWCSVKRKKRKTTVLEQFSSFVHFHFCFKPLH